MALLKNMLLSIYQPATAYWRRRYLRQMTAERRVPLAILFYHRVADVDLNPITMTNDQFCRQIDWLSKRFEMISLEEARRRIAEGVNDRPAVHISFDDGYADNMDRAMPFLIERKIPCTYFVSLGHILSGRPFQHDVDNWQALPVNSADEIRYLADEGIEIGGHTRWHTNLGPIIDLPRLEDEITETNRELGELAGRPIRYFSFPFGLPVNMNPIAFEVARRSGCETVLSAYGGLNHPGVDPFYMQRISATENTAALRNWLTYDPRKINLPRYDYEIKEPWSIETDMEEIETKMPEASEEKPVAMGSK